MENSNPLKQPRSVANMGKFRKRPIEIEAHQFNTFEDYLKIEDWMRPYGCKPSLIDHEILIKTLEGVMVARPGWWIIKGVEDEFYPCDPNIFEKTYEPIWVRRT